MNALYQYDALGRLTGVLDALGQLTQYRYDELGRLIEAEDANGQVTAYEYDRLGRRIAVELPLEQHSSMAYDAVGNLVSMTDFNGEVTAYGYDAQNRLILTDYEDDADVSYTYTADGQVATITDGRGITSFDYDHQGRLLSRQDPDGPYLPSGNTIEYSYDEAGNRTSVTTPNGSVTYGYDERNRLTTVLDDDLNLTTYTYDDANNLVRTVFPNDTVEIRGYDDLNRLVELKTVYVDPTTGAETVLTGFDYTLNQSGHRLAVTEADGRQVNYTYDELYRLTEENINNGERVLAYTYDSVGNRLTKDDSLVGLTTYTYDANDRLLSEVLTQAGVTIHTITYTYDDNGNLLSRTQVTDAASETTTYTWNDDDRLVAVATPDGSSVTYEYDEQGIRVSSTVDGVTTDYLVDKNRPYAQVLEEFNSEQLQAFYVYGHDLISQTRNTQQDFYLVDGLGSTRALTDENGNVTDTYDYEAFGELIESSGESENSYQFAGEQFDEELGNYYLRQRFYDADTGRFTRRDSYEGNISEPLTIHKYLYAHGNPVHFTDPSGFASRRHFSDEFGDQAHEEISLYYMLDFMGDTIYFGEAHIPDKSVGIGKNPKLYPDIVNHSKKTYLEIKPFTPNGYTKGKNKMKRNKESLSSEGYIPDAEWKAPPSIGKATVMGRSIIFFNDFTGIVFYTDEIIIVPALQRINQLGKQQRATELRRLREGTLTASSVLLGSYAAFKVGPYILQITAQLTAQISSTSTLTKGLI